MDSIRQQKIEMWKKKLTEIQGELKLIMVKRGEAAREGDLSENAAYKMATEEAEMYRAKIAAVQKILADLDNNPKK